jgi:hypothetical protein
MDHDEVLPADFLTRVKSVSLASSPLRPVLADVSKVIGVGTAGEASSFWVLGVLVGVDPPGCPTLAMGFVGVRHRLRTYVRTATKSTAMRPACQGLSMIGLSL